MKTIVALLFTLGVIFFWTADSGYKYISFAKDFGTDFYSNEKDATTTSTVATSSLAGGTTTPPFVVTHVKTPKNVKAIYMFVLL